MNDGAKEGNDKPAWEQLATLRKGARTITVGDGLPYMTIRFDTLKEVYRANDELNAAVAAAPENTSPKCNSQGAPKQHFCEKPVAAALRDEAYDQIDRFLRNNLDDTDYADYSQALDLIFLAPSDGSCCPSGNSAQAAVVDKSTPQE